MTRELFRDQQSPKPARRRPDRKPVRFELEQLETRWLLSAGALDLSFNGSGKVTTPIGTNTDEVRAVAVQADGKIVVAGRVLNGKYDFGLARYNPNGSLDTT